MTGPANTSVPKAYTAGCKTIDDKTRALLDNSEKLVKKIGVPTLMHEFEQIKQSLAGSKFTVAVVGEFSRGKSTLVNNLVGKNILPTDVTPTTALITRIVRREKEQIVFVDKKGNKTAHALDKDSWNGYTAGHIDSGSAVAFVGVNCDWLGKNGIEIIDTPGTNDPVAERSLLADKALIYSDSAIITISALTPFSNTERIFVKERVLFHSIPKTIICVTMLDLINEKEDRLKLISRIREQARELGLDDVIIAVPQGSLIDDAEKYGIICGTEAIRELISSWTHSEDLKELKRYQIQKQLCDIFLRGRQLIEEKKNVLIEAKNKELSSVISQKADELEQKLSKWKDTEESMLQKLEDTANAIDDALDQKKEILTEQLCHELSKSTNPKSWAESDYPYSLKMKVLPISQTVEMLAAKALSRDAAWLQNSAKALLGITANLQSEGDFGLSVEAMTNTQLANNIKLSDLNKARSASRLVVGASQIAGFVLIGLIPGVSPIFGSIGGSTLSSTLTQKGLDGKLKTQKEQLTPLLTDDINRLIGMGKLQIRLQLKTAYNKAINTCSASIEEWKKAAIESYSSIKTGKGADISMLTRLSDNLSLAITTLSASKN